MVGVRKPMVVRSYLIDTVEHPSHAIHLSQRVYICCSVWNGDILVNVIIFTISYVAYMTSGINTVLLQGLI